ncbi:hypothetical protein BC332_01456 [Capsicum chinense]|nr:hypothetical protein BC332_01456 [Capsicum chinense]
MNESRSMSAILLRKCLFKGHCFGQASRYDTVSELASSILLVEHEDVGGTSNYSVGQECLDRLSIASGGNTIVPVDSEQLGDYLVSLEQ